MKIIEDKRKKLELKASQIIAGKIRSLLKVKDKVIFAIPGGKSVSGIFSILRKEKLSWQKVHIFMVDERYVSLDDDMSNYGLAYDSFIRYLFKQHKLPRQNVHPYIYYKLNGKQGINAYKNELREFSHSFDIVLLSAGEDGHVASLFPDHDSVKNQSDYFIKVDNSPKPPKNRMTASRKLLERSGMAVLLFFGICKRDAYEKFLNAKTSVFQCPAKLVQKIEESWILTDVSL
jgi:6-phosphogluconolactonase